MLALSSARDRPAVQREIRSPLVRLDWDWAVHADVKSEWFGRVSAGTGGVRLWARKREFCPCCDKGFKSLAAVLAYYRTRVRFYTNLCLHPAFVHLEAQ